MDSNTHILVVNGEGFVLEPEDSIEAIWRECGQNPDTLTDWLFENRDTAKITHMTINLRYEVDLMDGFNKPPSGKNPRKNKATLSKLNRVLQENKEEANFNQNQGSIQILDENGSMILDANDEILIPYVIEAMRQELAAERKEHDPNSIEDMARVVWYDRQTAQVIQRIKDHFDENGGGPPFDPTSRIMGYIQYWAEN